MCGNDTRSPVTSRESAAHGHTQREGKIHGARPPPPATPRAAPAWPSARGPHSPAPRSPHPPRGSPTRRGPAQQSTELVSQVSAGRIKAAARWRRRLQSRRTRVWLQHPCRGGGGRRGGDAQGGCPERARGRSAHPRAGPSRRNGHPAPTDSPRPLCRAPLCARSERSGSMAFRGARAPRGGGRGGHAVERSAAPPPPHSRFAPAPHPRRAPRWSGRAAGRLCEARGGLGARSRPGYGGARLGMQNGVSEQEQGAGTGARCRAGSRGPRSRRSEGRSLRSQQMERGRPVAAAVAVGSDQGRAPPPEGAALPPRPSTARFAVPAARELEAGPAPWACARLARGLPGQPRNQSPGVTHLVTSPLPLS